MNRFVVSFYPGAGGNRFAKKMTGNNWNVTDKLYDDDNTQDFQYKYLENFKTNTHEKIILTHNVNSVFIKKYFPDRTLIQICYDLQACLRREWMLYGKERYKQRVQFPSRAEHYKIYKDPSWPNLENNFESLPESIRQELEDDYKKVCSNVDYKKDSCVETIKWHLNYYKKYPLDVSCADKVINIENGNDEFSQFMREEIDRYQNVFFDTIWSKIVND